MSLNEKKTDKRIIRSKTALKQALLTLMEKNSFHAISITEIVEQADYNRGTFYMHYDGKEALLDDIFTGLIDELLQSFRAPYEKVDVFRVDELPADAIKIFEHFYDHAAIYTTLFKSDVLPVFREKIFMALKENSLEELAHADDGVNPEFLVIYSMNALLGLIFHWIETGFAYPPSYMQEQLVKLINWRPTTAKIVRKH